MGAPARPHPLAPTGTPLRMRLQGRFTKFAIFSNFLCCKVRQTAIDKTHPQRRSSPRRRTTDGQLGFVLLSQAGRHQQGDLQDDPGRDSRLRTADRDASPGG